MSSNDERRPERTTVLFLHQGRDWIRGSERCMLDLAANLDPNRFLPIVASNSPSVNRLADNAGLKTALTSGWDEAGERLLPSRARLAEMRELIEHYHVGLIHANNPMPLKAVIPTARARHLPIVAHIHLRMGAHERLYTGLHQATMVVGVSEYALSGVRDDGLPAKRCRVIHNGVDERRFTGGDARRLREILGINPDDVLVTAVTSLIELKGIDVLLQSMAQMDSSGTQVHLLVIGDGPKRAEYFGMAAHLNVAGRVHFAGDREDVGAILRDATDIVVTASRSEAFPLNVLEAGFAGRPVVASDIPAHREAIVDRSTGVLVPADDPAALAAAIRRLADDRQAMAVLGQNASRYVRERFLLRHYVSSFETLYSELIGADHRQYGWLRGGSWPPAYFRWLASAAGRRLGVSQRA